MKREELTLQVEQLIDDAYNAGFMDASNKAAGSFEMLAAVVPGSVTKNWLIDQCRREAMKLRMS